MHLGQGGQHAVHEHLGLPGHGVLNGGDTALVGDVLPACATGALQRHACQVRCAACGRHGKVQVVLLGVGDQFLEVVHRHRGVHHQQVGRVGQHGHATQVFGRVERQLGVHRWADGQCAHVAQQQRVAIGLGLGHQVGAQVAVGACLVFHDHALLERFRQHLADGSRNDVRTAAGRVGHDDAHRLAGPFSRVLCKGAGRGQQGKAGQYGGAAKDGHGIVSRW